MVYKRVGLCGVDECVVWCGGVGGGVWRSGVVGCGGMRWWVVEAWVGYGREGCGRVEWLSVEEWGGEVLCLGVVKFGSAGWRSGGVKRGGEVLKSGVVGWRGKMVV